MAATVLLLDLPYGFALRTLERMDRTNRRVVVLTETSCPEYRESLWDLQPASVLTRIQLDQALVDLLGRVARGDRYRPDPQRSSSLTAPERAVLQALARGWNNRRIAAHLHVEEKTVRNTLTTIYAKLKVTNRVEAALYYWSREDLFL
jgi:DNA-binding NarL/FixJ family response regulator